MIVKTEAVILKAMKYRETSKILTMYTRAFGKISVLAKGARDRKSKFGSALEPMNYVLAVLYWKGNRELQLLSQCDLMKALRRLPEDLDRLHAAMSVVELVNVVTHAEEENEQLFRSTVTALEVINEATQNPVNVLFHFELHLARMLGFAPNVHYCIHCQTPLDDESMQGRGGLMVPASGGISCARCSAHQLGEHRLSLASIRVLQRLQELSTPESTLNIRLTQAGRNEIAGSLRAYLASHVEGMHRLNTDKVFAAIA